MYADPEELRTTPRSGFGILGRPWDTFNAPCAARFSLYSITEGIHSELLAFSSVAITIEHHPLHIDVLGFPKDTWNII